MQPKHQLSSICIPYTDPQLFFMSAWSQSWWHFFVLPPPPPPKFCITSWGLISLSLSGTHLFSDHPCCFLCKSVIFCFLFSYHSLLSASPFCSISIQFVVFLLFFIFWGLYLYFLLSFDLTSFFFKYLLFW